MSKGKQLMLETKIKDNHGFCVASVRTIEQTNGTYLTVAYVSPGIDDSPIVDRYADGWEKHHEAMVAQCRKWEGIK